MSMEFGFAEVPHGKDGSFTQLFGKDDIYVKGVKDIVIPGELSDLAINISAHEYLSDATHGWFDRALGDGGSSSFTLLWRRREALKRLKRQAPKMKNEKMRGFLLRFVGACDFALAQSKQKTALLIY